MTEDQIFAQWVVLELMGHRRLAGFLTEQEIAGNSFLRLDIPGQQGTTQWYSPSAVYAITPTTEDIARAVAATSQPAPVQRWELPAARDETEHAAAHANVEDAFTYENDGPF